MADPQTTDLVVEGAKIGGGTGLGAFATLVIQRVFLRADKDEGKLDQVLAAVNALGAKLDVITERQATTRADVDKLEAGVLQLQLQFAELKGKFDHLSEQLAK